MQHLLVGGNGHRLGRVDHPIHILLKDLLVTNGHDAVGIHGADMATCDADKYRVDLTPGHQLSLLNGTLNRVDR